MNKEICALNLVDEIILYYDARSKKHQITLLSFSEKKQYKDFLFIPCVLHAYASRFIPFYLIAVKLFYQNHI